MANGDLVKLAVLIDADNASAAVVKDLLEEVAVDLHGILTQTGMRTIPWTDLRC